MRSGRFLFFIVFFPLAGNGCVVSSNGARSPKGLSLFLSLTLWQGAKKCWSDWLRRALPTWQRRRRCRRGTMAHWTSWFMTGAVLFLWVCVCVQTSPSRRPIPLRPLYVRRRRWCCPVSAKTRFASAPLSVFVESQWPCLFGLETFE